MNDRQLKRTLIELAEDGVPAADLWPALRARLAARPAFAEKGNPMLKPVTSGGPTLALRALGTATLIVALLAAALLVTPQGRAWAQSLWQYFTVAPAESFAVEPMPAPDVNAPTDEPPSVNAEVCGDDKACQVASAAELLSYTPIVPAEGFAGLRLEAVQVAGDILNLSYAAQGGGGLVLSQGPDDLTASQWGQVASEAVQPVQVNGAPAEFVQGTFVVPAGSSAAVWEPTAPVLRLRWQIDGRTFELAKLGDPEHLEHLDQAALIALAESIH